MAEISIATGCSWLEQLIESISVAIPDCIDKLVSKLTYAQLAVCYVTKEKFNTQSVVADHVELSQEIRRIKEAPHNKQFYDQIFKDVRGTHVWAEFWEQVSDLAYGWNLNGYTPMETNGKFDVTLLTGKVSVIYKPLKTEEVWDIENLFTFNMKFLPMTRVVIVDCGGSLGYDKFDRFKTIFKNDKVTIAMMENEMARKFIPCDTTTLAKNLSDLTYYHKKLDRELLGLSIFIQNLCSYKISSKIYPFHPIVCLDDKEKGAEDCVVLLKILKKLEESVYSWYKCLERKRYDRWRLVLDEYEKKFGKK